MSAMLQIFYWFLLFFAEFSFIASFLWSKIILFVVVKRSLRKWEFSHIFYDSISLVNNNKSLGGKINRTEQTSSNLFRLVPFFLILKYKNEKNTRNRNLLKCSVSHLKERWNCQKMEQVTCDEVCEWRNSISSKFMCFMSTNFVFTFCAI